VAGPFNEYANKIRQELRSNGYMCDSDTDDSNTMNKKVRNAQLAQYNFIFGKF
jgi:threonyl-tRNA synthetase